MDQLIDEFEKRLREKDTELDTLQKILDQACLISKTDKKGNIIYVNDKFREVAQYTERELIGQPHNIVRHPDMPSAVFKELWATIGRGKIFRGVVKNRAKDGTPYWVDALIAPVMGDDGKPDHYIGVRYDITEQVLNEQKIEQAQRRSEAVLEACLDAVVTINQKGIIEYFNKRAEELWGYDRSEVLGQNVKMLTPDEHQEQHDNYLNNYLRTGDSKIIGKGRDIEIRNKEGNEVPCFLNLTETEAGGIRYFTAFVKDISEEIRSQRKAEQALKEITQAVRVINDLGKQTHTVSLNASIQAKVAGDQGRSFAVIAEEIRRLADMSKSEATRIQSMLDEIEDR